ncbi:MAG TPA: hypothetical protein DCX27_17110 [Balneola sp.]|nr:hypothetical protein [Balneola sp.]
MSSKNTSLPIDSLDFNNIKDNLKSYLSSQSVFSGYNFEGSGLNVLLDILAYNTHYQAFYNNMAISESFIDSAIKPDSINSLLKLLNYTPQSRTSAKSTVKVIFRPTSAGTIPYGDGILPDKSTFSATVGDNNFTFKNPDAAEFKACAYNDNGDPTEWITGELDIYEGTFFTYDLVYDSLNERGYVIPELNVDNRFLKVFIKDSQTEDSTTSNEWFKSDTILNVNDTTETYFLQIGLNRYYEIEFGDNVIGKRPDDGNIISIEYLRSKGQNANGIGGGDAVGSRVFSHTGDDGTFEVVVSTVATGGGEREQSSFSKKIGPRSFQSQNRLVTSEDYRTEILKRFQQLKSVLVYGGEDADPPQYGKVFVVGNTKNSVGLSDVEKNDIITNIIKTKNIVGIIPEFVDADYSYVRPNIDVLINNAFTQLSSLAVKSLVRQSVQDYTDNQLEDFGENFRGSTIIKNILTVNPSIVSVNLTIDIEKRIDPTDFFGTPKDYTVTFPGGVLQVTGKSSIESNVFVVNGVNSYIQDNTKGTLQLYTLDVSGKRIISNSNIGTINYTTGKVDIKQLNVQSIPNDSFIRLYASSKNTDVEVNRNQILVIDETDTTSVTINMGLSNDTPA